MLFWGKNHLISPELNHLSSSQQEQKQYEYHSLGTMAASSLLFQVHFLSFCFIFRKESVWQEQVTCKSRIYCFLNAVHGLVQLQQNPAKTRCRSCKSQDGAEILLNLTGLFVSYSYIGNCILAAILVSWDYPIGTYYSGQLFSQANL